MPESRVLRARIWVARVGRIPLLLLDSDVPENDHDMRHVTDRLYGVTRTTGSSRNCWPVSAGSRDPRVHRNRGHPQPGRVPHERGPRRILGLERVREYIQADRLDFDTALALVRSSTLFTTHTRCPPASTDSRSTWCSATGGDTDGGLPPGVGVERCWASEPSRIRRNSTWPTWAFGWRSAPTGCPSYTAGSAGDVQRSVVGIRRARGADRVDHQRGTRTHLGGAGVDGSGT